MTEPLSSHGRMLEVSDLTVRFGRRQTVAVDGISFQLRAGERLGIIGESGSGKSVTALALMGLLPETATITGSVKLDRDELLDNTDNEMGKLRGQKISMVFQEPLTALDPTMKAGRQVAEVLRLHRGAEAGAARLRVLDMLNSVGIDDPERIAESFPHQLSGGQRQRVLLAMALINAPALVICDEPTTALDVTVQARVLKTLRQQLHDTGAACLFISHDLAVVASICERVLVMREGRVVEEGLVSQVLANPQHGYTRALIAASRLDALQPGERIPVHEDFA